MLLFVGFLYHGVDIINGLAIIKILVSWGDANRELIHGDDEVLLESDHPDLVGRIVIRSALSRKAKGILILLNLKWVRFVFAFCFATCDDEMKKTPETEEKSPTNDDSDIGSPVKLVVEQIEK